MSFLPARDIVPVLVWHSVGMHKPSWVWQELSERADAFERLLHRLSAQGYQTVTLSQLHAHMSGEKLCGPKSVVLVFDDGYLDNWVTVAPLLRKYGMTGTVYVNPDFVEPGDELRVTLDDLPEQDLISGGASQTGFLNWAELRELDASGVLDVQSHAMTHTWYFKGPEIVDYYSPSTAASYPWMAWNARPERKPFYLGEDQSQFVAWGMPIFEHEKSLLVRRFVPDEHRTGQIVDWVNERGGAEFFSAEDWREQLQKQVASVTGGEKFPGSFETEEEYEDRVRDELTQSKTTIENKLHKSVEFLCWPGGGSNAVTTRIAAEVGYKSWNVPSRDLRYIRNRPGSDPQELRRMPGTRHVNFLNRHWGQGSERMVMLEMLAHKESRLFDVLRKCYKLAVAGGIAGARH
jgi:peptidoglycan/xylan/chitin deacetylase (PgdA/CDA1 family)